MSSTPLGLFWWQVYWFFLMKNASHLKLYFPWMWLSIFFFWNSFCLLHVSFSRRDYCLLPTSSSKLHLFFIPYFLIPALFSSLPPPSSFYLFSLELHPSYFSSDRWSLLLLDVIHPFHPALFSPFAFLKFIWTPQLCHLLFHHTPTSTPI